MNLLFYPTGQTRISKLQETSTQAALEALDRSDEEERQKADQSGEISKCGFVLA